MTGSAPNEEGLRALGRTIDDVPRPARKNGPAHARRGRGKARDTEVSENGHGGDGTPPGTPGGGKPPRPHKRRWLKRTLLISLAVIVIAVAAGAGYFYYLDHKIDRLTVRGLMPGATTGKDANTENILMVGSTTRCGLKKQTPAFGICTSSLGTASISGVNSDVIMILHVDPATHAVSILSLPRDLFIPNARSTGAYKVDAALAQGPTQLVAAIEEDFGIPIQHYVELTFDSFAAVVTTLGGITMEFPDGVFDRESGLRVLFPGCKHLTGIEALQVVRARHLQYWVPGYPKTYPYTWPQEAESDLARITRDHEFLRVLAAKMAKTGLGNPVHDLNLIDALAPHLKVDSFFSATAMADLVVTFHSVNVNKAPAMTLPVIVDTFGTYIYQGAPFGDVEFPANPNDHATIDKFLGLDPDDNTMTGKPLPPAGTVTVKVLNGTGVTGQATTTAAALKTLGFDVVGTGNTTPVGQYAETTVSYTKRTPADIAAAQLVADSISGAVILKYAPADNGSATGSGTQTSGASQTSTGAQTGSTGAQTGSTGAQTGSTGAQTGSQTTPAEVTVTTGTDFHVNSSLPAKKTAHKHTTNTTAPTSKSSHSTTTPGAAESNSTTSSTSGFTGVYPAVTPLTSYDPRACPAGVTGHPGNF